MVERLRRQGAAGRGAAQIVAKTDGVPLFVEELTKAVLESGLLTDAGDRYELAGPLPPLAIPTTLHDSLMARLDRSAPVKEVAQIGAVHRPRVLPRAARRGRADWPEAELQAALRPAGRGRAGVPPRARRPSDLQLQARAGAGCGLREPAQEPAPERCTPASPRRWRSASRTSPSAQPELLAHHCTEAGLTEKAVDYWSKAGERRSSARRSPKRSAQLQKGLELLAGLPDERDRRTAGAGPAGRL